LFCLLLAAAHAAPGGEPATRSVLLHPVAGDPIPLGTLTLTPEADGHRFQLTLDFPGLESKFLSMRPFRCLVGPQTVCHLPYPYENRRRISGTNLTDLEYALLFIRKTPEEYGIDPWNGLYYRLRWEADGRITGELHELDLNVLASPPPAGDLRPITRDQLHPAPAAEHWLPWLTIE